MKPLKAALFAGYCLLSLTVVGTALSHLWRTNKLRILERQQAGAAGLAPF